jgi:hypothetical protein
VLIDSIKRAARSGKNVVLAMPISFADDNLYRLDSDIYQAHGLCPDRKKGSNNLIGPPDPLRSNVVCGFIALTDDPIKIPPPIAMVDGSELDPFPLALAKAVNPELISRLLHKKKDLGYADFITHDMFQQANVIFSARAVRTGAIDRSALESKN